MSGKLFVIGVGPGDPELLTLKAVRILKHVPCIVVPKGREEGSSLALSIVQKALTLDGKEIVELHFPMRKTVLNAECGVRNAELNRELDAKWTQAAEAVLSRLDKGLDAAFITIGDPSIYSTFFYLYDKLLEKIPSLVIEMVPGISSINASAARAGLSLGLGDERIAVLPANYMDNLQETLEKFDTVVLMKVSKVFGAVRDVLVRMGLAAGATYVVRAGMEDERIERDIMKVRDEDLNYFSLLIVRKR
jgi:precorrin-2/cobalt-factor-2 C20-methyltransferase